MAEWVDLAEEILGSEDEIKRSYMVKLNDKIGYIVMSNRKLLFLKKGGFIRVHYHKTLELPYINISNVNVTSDFMAIIRSAGETLNFTEAKVKALMQRVAQGAENIETIGNELQDLIAKSKE